MNHAGWLLPFRDSTRRREEAKRKQKKEIVGRITNKRNKGKVNETGKGKC